MTEASVLVRETSRAGAVWGIVTLILGILAMCAPLLTGVAVNTIIAIVLIAAGLARLVFAFKASSFGEGLMVFLFGGLSVLFGAVMLARPLLGLASLTMVVVIYFAVDGISEIMNAFRVKPAKGWGWLLFSGVVTTALALMLWQSWPFSGKWAIGTLVGINLIITGWSMILLGSVGDEVADEVAAAS